MPVYIKKYRGDNYFRNRTYVDGLVLNSLPKDSFPRFRYETENTAGVGQYRAGDFDLTISLRQRELSVNGVTIKDFFLGSDRDFYYLVILVIGSQTFSGTVQAGKISGALTYNRNENAVTLIVKDIMLEWAARCEMVPISTINWGGGTLKTFEEYIQMHFAGITSDVVLLGLPTPNYLTRLRIPAYGNPGECFAFKDFFDFFTNQVNISRWETFKELAKGIGFNFEMYLNLGTELTSAPEFIFKIFFVRDIVNETPITLKILEHNEFTTEKRLEWLFLKYRYFVFSGVGYSQGILLNRTTSYYTDGDHSDGATLYPCILLTLNDKLITVTDSSGNTVKNVINDVDCKTFDLVNYNYDLASGGGIGKLYPLDEAQGGGMTFSHIFHTTVAPSIYDFNPIQRYAVTNYQRYLKGLQKAKSLKVVFNENTEIKLWKPVVLDDGAGTETHFISAIGNIDTINKTAEVETMKIS